MSATVKNAASVGLGCLVDVALFVVLVLAFPEDCAVSTLIYMMAMAIPVWIVRIAVFNEGTPRWARILIGPLGALVCLALAIAHPIALEDSSEADETPAIAKLTEKRDKNFGNARWARNLFEKSVERQSLRVTELPDPSAEELVTTRLKDLGVKLKDPAASDEE